VFRVGEMKLEDEQIPISSYSLGEEGEKE